MLHSQRTRPNVAKLTGDPAIDTFANHDQDALRRAMQKLDGENGSTPKPTWSQGGGTPTREQAEKNRKIVLDYLRANPECQAGDIAEATGWSTYKVSKYLSDLKHRGKATNRIGGRFTRKWVAV